jgi:hypothetical protein
MAELSYEQIVALISGNLPDNRENLITPVLHRQVAMAILNYSKACCTGIKLYRRVFTPAEIQSLNSSPILAIPAPGPGKAILLEPRVAFWEFGLSVPFSPAASIYLDSPSDPLTNGYGVNSDRMTVRETHASADFYENEAVYVTANTDSINGDGSILVTFRYSIVSIS